MYSLWRVGILTFLSFGLYYLYWMYVSWKHLAEEMPGKEFYPGWHALSQFVPIYNFVVMYQHFRTIKDAQEREKVESNLVPGLALALSIILPVILYIVLPVILYIGVWILAFALLWALQILSGTPAVAVLGGVVFILRCGCRYFPDPSPLGTAEPEQVLGKAWRAPCALGRHRPRRGHHLRGRRIGCYAGYHADRRVDRHDSIFTFPIDILGL